LLNIHKYLSNAWHNVLHNKYGKRISLKIFYFECVVVKLSHFWH